MQIFNPAWWKKKKKTKPDTRREKIETNRSQFIWSSFWGESQGLRKSRRHCSLASTLIYRENKSRERKINLISRLFFFIVSCCAPVWALAHCGRPAQPCVTRYVAAACVLRWAWRRASGGGVAGWTSPGWWKDWWAVGRTAEAVAERTTTLERGRSGENGRKTEVRHMQRWSPLPTPYDPQSAQSYTITPFYPSRSMSTSEEVDKPWIPFAWNYLRLGFGLLIIFF